MKYDEATDLHLDALLDTIKQHELRTNTKVDADVLTWRGMMTKVSDRKIRLMQRLTFARFSPHPLMVMVNLR